MWPWIATHITDNLQWLVTFTIIPAIIVAIVGALSRRARELCGTMLIFWSYAPSLACWFLALEFVHIVWGWLGVIIGFGLAVVGMVPLALLAAITHATWPALGLLTYYLALALGSRAAGLYMGVRAEKERELEPG